MRNERARFSVVFGLLSLAAIPVALYSTRLKNVNLPRPSAARRSPGRSLA